MIGSALAKALVAKGYQVVVLSRRQRPPAHGIVYKTWDVENGRIDASAISEANHIVHLAGANIASKRWTEKRKKELVSSRVDTGSLLVQYLNQTPNKVRTVVSASAIGWYGEDPSVPNYQPFVETDKASNDFLGATCKKWEAAIQPVTEKGIRLVILRCGIVLSNEGGAFVEFRKPVRFRVATILGTGNQVISWIHLDDLVQLYIDAIENPGWEGVFNAVAPNPVSNVEMMTTIAAVNDKKYICVKVPEPLLKIALGEMSIEVLKSTTVSSAKVEAAGFSFAYPKIDGAIHNLMQR